ncbi:hypothetical protein AL542_16095 [Grimontia hollisae]|uniref:Lipoprotein n=2 Tax=Grimontia hollisae TaxID=673 RepID=D0I9Z7_GRIHO|nr:DUF6279 family lipoprotein [Grimontia hollisae]AMG31707.1 hypothetical protein AL542_16095 [Grimontia hollisae]EEY70715.1 hypothetical protein VHA_002572 [Grimontia hollisae CIP 101886]MDF2186082.1 DUF6279 family lipoprotein [Grimontia hollisae]STO45035.1 Uncharacterised protein [Grimontia hollisae]STO57691.1 Uncharacterised protein [Grimontia hollisae]
MKLVRSRIKPFLLSVTAVVILSACTNQFAYNTLPFWIDYYLSDYVDLNASQQKQLDTDLSAFHEWHRQSELPKIQRLLHKLEADMATPLSYPQIREYHQQVNAVIYDSLSGLTPALTNLISSLSDEQAKVWLDTVNENIQEAVEKANEGDLEAQYKRRQEKLIARAEFWVQSVNDKQQRQFLEMARYQIEMRPVFYSIRNTLVAELEGILMNRNAPDLEQRINTYFTHLLAFDSEQHQNDMAIYYARRYELLQRLDRHLSDKQRAAFRDKLASYSADITDVLN